MGDDRPHPITRDPEDVLERTAYPPLLAWSLTLAVPIAVLTASYLILLGGLTTFLWETVPATYFPAVDLGLYTIAVATTGGLLVGLVVRYLGRPVGKTLQHELAEEGRVEYRGVPAQILGAIIGLAAGASLGPEGPLAHLAGGIATRLSERLKYPVARARVLALSGIAAAFGGFLQVPAGSAFLSIEFTGLLRFPLYANLVAGTLAGVVGVLIVQAIGLPSLIGPYHFEDVGSEPIYLVYAVALGLLGVGHAFVFKLIAGATKRLATWLPASPIVRSTLGGLVFGIIGAIQPLTLFSGERELEVIIEQGAEMGFLLLVGLAVVKLVTLSVCLQTGFPGGFVFPILFSAGTLGAAVHVALPFIPMPVAMLCAMAGVGGALMRLPFSTFLLLLLLTEPAVGPYLIVAALTGFLVATLAGAGNARASYQEAAARTA